MIRFSIYLLPILLFFALHDQAFSAKDQSRLTDHHSECFPSFDKGSIEEPYASRELVAWIEEHGLQNIFSGTYKIKNIPPSEIPRLNQQVQKRGGIALVELLYQSIFDSLPTETSLDVGARLSAIKPYIVLRVKLENTDADLGSKAGSSLSEMIKYFHTQLESKETSLQERRIATEFLGFMASTPLVEAETKKLLVAQLFHENNWVVYSAVIAMEYLFNEKGPLRRKMVARLYNLLDSKLSYTRYKSMQVLAKRLSNDEIQSSEFLGAAKNALKDESPVIRDGVQKALWMLTSRKSKDINRTLLDQVRLWKKAGILGADLDLRFYLALRLVTVASERDDEPFIELIAALVGTSDWERSRAIKAFNSRREMLSSTVGKSIVDAITQNFRHVDELGPRAGKDAYRYGATFGLTILPPVYWTSSFLDILLEEQWYGATEKVHQNVHRFLMGVTDPQLFSKRAVEKVQKYATPVSRRSSRAYKAFLKNAQELQKHIEKIQTTAP